MNLEKCFVTDEEVLAVMKSLENEEEKSVAKATLVKLALLVDIRRFLRHINNNLKKPNTKVYKRPTGKKEDIVVGKKESE